MEGGCAITNDGDVYKKLIELRDFGQFDKKTGDVSLPGLNSKMQEISAIVGLRNLNKFEYLLEKRKNVIKLYEEFFKTLENKGHIKRMRVHNNVDCIYLYYPIILQKGGIEEFIEYLANKNIAVRRYYTLVHMLTYYKDRFLCGDLSYTEKELNGKVVALPLHSLMEEDEINYLFDSITEYFEQR